MVLHAECWQLAMADAFDCLVIQAAMRDLQSLGQACFGDSKSMVLRRDLHHRTIKFLHWLVCAAMAKLHFERLRPTC